VNGQLHASASLPSGKQPRCPLYTRLDGPQSGSGRYREETNLLPHINRILNIGDASIEGRSSSKILVAGDESSLKVHGFVSGVYLFRIKYD
jgi:hypothetical protein